jgi:hypothetical protein
MSSVGTNITVRLTSDEVRWLWERYPPSQRVLQCDDQGRNILAAVARELPEPRYRLALEGTREQFARAQVRLSQHPYQALADQLVAFLDLPDHERGAHRVD